MFCHAGMALSWSFVTEVINLNSGKYNKKYINLCIDFIQRINRNSMEALLNLYKKHFKSYED